MKSTDKYFDRERSWLEFNRRVLNEARGEDTPLLERVKFLGISASNLDEFFQVRVGGLKMVLAQDALRESSDGAGMREQLQSLQAAIREFCQSQESLLLDELEPALAEHNIRRLTREQWDTRQVEFLKRQFDEQISSVLAPLGIDPAAPFPLLAGAPLCVCVSLKSAGLGPAGEAPTTAEDGSESLRHAIIPIGRSVQRIWTLPSETGYHFVLLEDIVVQYLRELFPQQQVVDHTVFRVTRNADLEFDDDGAGDLLAEVEQLLEARRSSACVRLEIASGASSATRAFLCSSLGIGDHDVFECRAPIDLTAFLKLTQLQGRETLKDEPWPPLPAAEFPSGGDVFEAIASADRLLFHPYQSFDPVAGFVRAAAEDPSVLSIKLTLYRTARNSAIVAALAHAARSGKSVTAIVELKARFDEERNIGWAKQLEIAGVDVVYGLPGLKVHSKICVVIRREPDGIRRYVHLATGNYNEVTARVYSDISYFSCDAQLGDDAIRFFNAISGFSIPLAMRQLTMAPVGLRERILELIAAETQAASEGEPSGIQFKVNSLVDAQIIDALYDASQAGVPIQLNVRGICCLRPRVKGMSDKIRVISIVDRYLEHSRIFRFARRGDELVLIGSSDLMPRNLDRRVELLAEITDKYCASELVQVLETYFKDNVKAYELQADGQYVRPSLTKKTVRVRSQQALYQRFKDQFDQANNAQTKLFRPIRGQAEGA